MNTETIIQQHMPNIRIARRKGTKIRLQNMVTAKMGPWVTDPRAKAAEVVAPGKSREVKVAALQAVAEANYRSMTVPALRAILLVRYGLKPTTRTKKDALVHTLVELSTHK